MPVLTDGESRSRTGFVPVSPDLVSRSLFTRRKHWAERFGTAPLLPTSRAEMDALGWESCDVVLVTGDAYVDHPSFGMALVGRLLEAQGFRVGILSQPDWKSAQPFTALGRPTVMWGVTAGNMDSMVNRYTADRRLRHDDAYTPGGAGGKRPDRAVVVYAQRCREAFPDVPIVLGGIEASLRRIAHYDYWSDKVRRSVLLDAKADLLVYGNGERAIVEIAHRLAAGEEAEEIRDLRGTAFSRPTGPPPEGWSEIDSREVDTPGAPAPRIDPYADTTQGRGEKTGGCEPAAPPSTEPALVPAAGLLGRVRKTERARTVVRLPDADTVAADPILYAHASRLLHVESNPGNARALVQRHGDRDVWLNPPPLPLSTPELDRLYELPYTRRPHPPTATPRSPPTR
jgi:uncharacterized radical SAM protein YgiQ